MKVFKADTLKDSFHLHKLMVEYHKDLGTDYKDDGRVWIKKNSNPNVVYILGMHGKKPVGMVWGRVLDDENKRTILVEGKFLRRAYRGKPKFGRYFADVMKSLKKDFESVRLVIPGSRATIGKRKVLGVIVEVK